MSKKGTEKVHFAQRREEISKAYIKLGERNLNKAALARQYDCTRKQIYADLKWIKSNIPEETVEQIRKDNYYSLITAKDEARKMVVDIKLTASERQGAMREVNRAAISLTKQDEDYNRKPKSAERNIIQIDLMSKAERQKEIERIIKRRKKSKVIWSKKSDNWETPKELFDELNKEFKFDFDPCPINPVVDGLKYYWGKSNFVNPPHSQIAKWMEKGYSEWKKGKTVVFLIPSRTDTKWFHKYVYGQAEIRFIKVKLKFSNSKNSAPFPSMICIFRNKLGD